MKIDTLRKQLDKLNSEIAVRVGLEPIALSYQAGAAEKDPIFLYGVVGGKDVGKTVLINQLAGDTISMETDLLDEGTQTAVAYCHHQDLPELKKRFSAEVTGGVKFVDHDRAVLRNVVLIDLPDFDSRFKSHREDSRRFTQHLQGIIWVTTPRKYGDHELLNQLEAVAQSHENYFVVINKIDQLENIADADIVKHEIINYLNEQCRKRRISSPDPAHFFIISALEPGHYEFNQLHDRLIRQHSPEEIQKAKNKNLYAEFSKNLEKIYAYYDLQAHVETIERALDHIQEEVAAQFADNYYETVWRRVANLDSLRRRISGTLFAQQIKGWPILRLLFYPLAGIVSGFGGRLAFSKADQQLSEAPRDLLRYQGQPASLRMQKIRMAVEKSFPRLKKDFGDVPDFAKPLENMFYDFLNQYEDQVADRLLKDITAPGLLKRLFVYLPLIWFPFLQPLCLHWAEIKGPVFSIAWLKEFYPVIIHLFGAGSLLVSLVFLLLFYTVWLVLIYAYGARKTQQKGEEEFKNLWFTQFLIWTAEALAHPLPQVRAVLTNKILQLDQIQSTIENLTSAPE